MRSADQQLHWNQTVSQVLDSGYSEQSMTQLLKSIEELVAGHSGIITLYPKNSAPYSPYHRLLANDDHELQLDKYASGSYLLDPFYHNAVKENFEGTLTLQQAAPAGFEESEYFRIFYQQLGFNDEVCMLFQLDNALVISISIGRHLAQSPFSVLDIEQLNIIYPLIKSLMNQWVKSEKHSVRNNLEWHLDQALANFGSSMLTPKECHILHLILHGHSVKLIAQKLDNSLETIKHHRRNIYTKLDVSSQAELFYLFIAALKSIPENTEGDPLTYLSK